VPPRLLITGAGGLLAPHIAAAAGSAYATSMCGRSHGDFSADLADANAVDALFDALRPELVVHAAALTDVDRCEGDPASAFKSNAIASMNVARASVAAGAHLIVISTDQVYGRVGAPHLEDAASPVNWYGRSKLAGEWAALAASTRCCVLRTNFFGPSISPRRASLSDFFISAFSKGQPVMLFEDVEFSPLHLQTLSKLILESFAAGLAGVFNLGAREGISKAEFGRLVAAHLGISSDSGRSGKSSDLPDRAPRPSDLRLDVAKFESALGIRLPSVREEIRLL